MHAYSLVEQRDFDGARAIWSEIWERTRDHKALHQLGYVKREEGDLEAALEIFHQESALISSDDKFAHAVNLHELCLCNHLLGRSTEANNSFEAYRSARADSDDAIEIACYFRLKGDLLAQSDSMLARDAYQESLNKFEEACDPFGIRELEERLKKLESGRFL